MPVGYPDWQRVQYASGGLIGHISGTFTTAQVVGPINVQSWNQLLVEGRWGAGDNYTVDAQWFSDNGVTLLPPTTQACFSSFSAMPWGVPVLGPFVELTINPVAGTAFANTSVYVYGSSPIYTPGALKDSSLASDNFTQVAAANTNYNQGLIQWYNGRMMVDAFTSAGGPCTVELDYFDPRISGYRRFWQASVPASGQMNPNVVQIPPYPVQLIIQNGGTAQTVNVNLTPIVD